VVFDRVGNRACGAFRMTLTQAERNCTMVHVHDLKVIWVCICQCTGHMH
jgi:hypothetical protein